MKRALGVAVCMLFWHASGLASDLAIPIAQIESENDSRYFIVSIGINHYTDAFWAALKWPASDASRVADGIGLRTGQRIIKTLLINESATHANIVKTLDDVAATAQERDVVVLYVSAHGTLAQNASGEWERVVVTYDTQQDEIIRTGLAQGELQQWLQRLRARKKLLVFATCHGGEGKSRLPPAIRALLQTKKGTWVPLHEVSEGTLILAASAQDEAARESDSLQGDIYTYYWLEALHTYDRNRDGRVSAMEAHDYARERTWAFSQGRQRPTAVARFIGDADVPLVGRKNQAGLPVLEAYDGRLAGFIMQVDDGVKGALPSAFPLNPRGSEVKLYTAGADQIIARYKVKAAAGSTLTLEQIMQQRAFSLSLDWRRFHWDDSAWRRLSGHEKSQALHIGAGKHWGAWGVGAGFTLPYHEQNTVRLQIAAGTELTGGTLWGEYRYRLSRGFAGAQLEAGYESMRVELKDASTGDRLRFDGDSPVIGASVMATYRWRGDMEWFSMAGIRHADWSFPTLGDLNGQRRYVSIGMRLGIDGFARTLW